MTPLLLIARLKQLDFPCVVLICGEMPRKARNFFLAVIVFLMYFMADNNNLILENYET